MKEKLIILFPYLCLIIFGLWGFFYIILTIRDIIEGIIGFWDGILKIFLNPLFIIGIIILILYQLLIYSLKRRKLKERNHQSLILRIKRLEMTSLDLKVGFVNLLLNFG